MTNDATQAVSVYTADGLRAMNGDLGVLIRRTRAARSMKQQDFAAAVGTTPSVISHIEHGRYVPGYDVASRLANVLNGLPATAAQVERPKRRRGPDSPSSVASHVADIERENERLRSIIAHIKGALRNA
jgi:transcriptional regulator with XRE-family HTH domain